MSIEPFINRNLIRQIQRQSSTLQKLSECGPDCQRTRHIDRLRDERTRAQQNLNNAPGNFERANKDYISNNTVKNTTQRLKKINTKKKLMK